MTYPLNYTFVAEAANGNVIKGDVVNHASLKGDNGAGTDLSAQLEQNQALRVHKTLCACGALGQTIKVKVDVANSAVVTTAAALELTVYENVPESEAMMYFDNKFGFGRAAPQHSNVPLGGVTRQKSVFSGVGDPGTLSGDARVVYDPDVAAGGAIVTITPNPTDVILLTENSRIAFLGDTA